MPALRPEVLVTRRIPSTVLKRLQSQCDVDLHGGEGRLTPEELRDRVQGKQGLICLLTDRVDAAVIEAGAELRIIANIAVGYDNIDLASASRRQIVVTNTPDVLTNSVAEFTWALILAVARRLSEGDRLLRQGKWRGWALDFMLGSELRGKRLGIVGLGRIGRAVAARAPVFGMEVVYAGRTGVALPPAPLAPKSDMQRVSLDELLVTSDVVSLHVPLTAETHHLLGQRGLARMKRSAYLINTSRGAVVDEPALVWALTEQLIAGAGLDVYEQEPSVNPGLLTMENVVLAPHLGSATREARTAMADLAVSNVLAVLSGDSAVTPVLQSA